MQICLVDKANILYLIGSSIPAFIWTRNHTFLLKAFVFQHIQIDFELCSAVVSIQQKIVQNWRFPTLRVAFLDASKKTKTAVGYEATIFRRLTVFGTIFNLLQVSCRYPVLIKSFCSSIDWIYKD